MAEKFYLDEVGLRHLIEYIQRNDEDSAKAIELLNETDSTPGSIKYMINDAFKKIDIADLNQEEPVIFYGGSASDVMQGGSGP